MEKVMYIWKCSYRKENGLKELYYVRAKTSEEALVKARKKDKNYNMAEVEEIFNEREQ